MDEMYLDDILSHAGVKGMKWGVRKQRLNSTNNRRSGAHTQSGQRLARSRNSKKLAITKQVGKTVGLSLLTNLGTGVAAQAFKTPKAKMGLGVVNTILQQGVFIKGGMDIYGIAKYDQKKVNNG